MDHDSREIAHSDRIGHRAKLEYITSKLGELVISFKSILFFFVTRFYVRHLLFFSLYVLNETKKVKKKITRAQRLKSKVSENVCFYTCLKTIERKTSASTSRYLMFYDWTC